MKPLLPLLAATFAGLLAGCASWSGSSGSQPEYMSMQGGPGYGPTGPTAQYNAAPEGPPPPDMLANSDAWGASGGGGNLQSTGSGYARPGATGGGTSGSQAAGAGGMADEPGIGSGSASERDSRGSSSAGAASSGAPLDQQSACELQRRVSTARTPEERQALMDQAMPGMAPETQERHLQMMREGCQ